jgi:RND family efflux transporter MFP subunit
MNKISAIKNKRSKARKLWIPILAVVVIVAFGSGYFLWQKQSVQAEQTTTEQTYTTQVRRGSISLVVTGSGTLEAGQEKNLAFSASGTVSEVNVMVGDQVKAGDVLAVLSNHSELRDVIHTAQLSLDSAEEELETLKQSAGSNLAEAKLAVVQAEKAVTDAKSGVVQKGWARCDQVTINAYYYKYVHAKDYLDSLGDGDGNNDYYVSTILPQKNIVAQAKQNYEYCAGYTDYEISSSQATLLVAEANFTKAQAALEKLTANSGIDPIELATAENKISSAELNLETAKEALAGATITAPFDGTILSVAGSAGDSAGTGTFITIADFTHPVVNFSVDEADMDKLSEGQAAEVVFDALPNAVFKGTLTRVDPSLTNSGSYKLVTGVIQLDLSQSSTSDDSGNKLLKGLNGTVLLIEGEADNVLVVPLQALRDLGDGAYSVFVVGSDGKLKMRVVEVGLQDETYAEIKSGLEAGEVVSTGTEQVK